MSYTADTCPNLACKDCAYWDIRADLEGHESLCKRIDHKTVRFSTSPFAAYSCGAGHTPCADFQPKHPDYADFLPWEGMASAWPVFVEAWLPYGTPPKYAIFTLPGNPGVRYDVPFDLFFNGGLICDGVLQAVRRSTIVRDRIDRGVQLYRIKPGVIQGVVIATGEELV